MPSRIFTVSSSKFEPRLETVEGTKSFVFSVDDFGVGHALGSPVAAHSHSPDVLEAQPQFGMKCGEASPIAFIFDVSVGDPRFGRQSLDIFTLTGSAGAQEHGADSQFLADPLHGGVISDLGNDAGCKVEYSLNEAESVFAHSESLATVAPNR
ncbi:hypothetical protein AYI70_g4318 [Smittium culicis]|uniref:Uncharacterized protein n=1 Tax=Smittium culicis TaxID=133412 RepID=A0A1R1XZT9_9FUNG|nr:hypothetical protein AYI70_g4318 [Smittium culicis]